MRKQRIQQRAVPVWRLDKNLRLLAFARLLLQLAQAFARSVGIDRQIAVKREALAVQARCHQGQQD